jgi:hypothetical protein
MNIQWLQITQLAIGLCVGLVLGYELNLEKSAAIMAKDSCGICQDNLAVMVSNFNTLARDCPTLSGQAQAAYKDLPVFSNNTTVRVYAP